MGKTIEERAKINAVKAIEYACGRREGEPNYVTKLFIKMATEQKDIDIDERDTAVYNLLLLKLDAEKELWLDKACEWLSENITDYEIHNGKIYNKGIVKRFRKAMEE